MLLVHFDLTNEDLFNWIKKHKISVSKTFKDDLDNNPHLQLFTNPYYWGAFYVVGK